MQEQGQLLDSSLNDSEKRQKSYASVVKGQCKEVMSTISMQIEKLPSKQVNNKETSNAPMQFTGIFDAFVDRERRKNNVVVHNLPESDGDTHVERMTRDRSKLGELLRKELSLNARIVKTFHVGKFTQGKNCLLIATMDSEETKWEVVRIAPQLRGTDTGNNIYINPDSTEQEREEGKRLRSQLAECRAKGERNLVIHRGKIIKFMQASDGPDSEQLVGRQETEQDRQEENSRNESNEHDMHNAGNETDPVTRASDAPTPTFNVSPARENAADVAADGLPTSSCQLVQGSADGEHASHAGHHDQDVAEQHTPQRN